MYKELIYLTFVGIISYIYNLYIYSIIITHINITIYNHFIISLLILIQCDNILLFNELKYRKINDNEDMYIKNVLNQIQYNNQQINKLKYKLKYNKRYSKSCNDINKIR